MILIIPFTYLFLCAFVALIIENSKRSGFLYALAACILLTPFIAYPLSFLFSKRPEAYCMIPYHCFKVGEKYPYKIVKKKNRVFIYVYHDKTYKLDRDTFNAHFSMVVERRGTGERSSSAERFV